MRHTALVILSLAMGCTPVSNSRARGDQAPATSPAVSPPPGAPRLGLPVDCKIGVTCELQNSVDRDPGPGAKDYRCGHQTYDTHSGVDIRLPDLRAQRTGVSVLAAAGGRVSRLRDGVPDLSVKDVGASSVAGQECGNGVVIDHGQGWETQYCHLAMGSLRVKIGDSVVAGQPIAQVGLSGNTEYPHLHLTVRAGATVIDPFAPVPGPCNSKAALSEGLWDQATARMLMHRRGVVLNSGFAAAPISAEELETGGYRPPNAASQALVAFVRAINLEAGDVQTLALLDASGQVLAQRGLPPLDRAKAQYIMYAGKRSPQGWKRGEYSAIYTVKRRGVVVLQKSFSIQLGAPKK